MGVKAPLQVILVILSMSNIIHVKFQLTHKCPTVSSDKWDCSLITNIMWVFLFNKLTCGIVQTQHPFLTNLKVPQGPWETVLQ